MIGAFHLSLILSDLVSCHRVTMALSTRIRVPASQKNPFVRCRSTSVIVSSSIVDAKSRVREHARQISRSSAAKATLTPSMYVGAFHLLFNIQLTP